MNRLLQRGYINLDALITGLLVLGFIIGVISAIVVPWLWGLIKPWLHVVTA